MHKRTLATDMAISLEGVSHRRLTYFALCSSCDSSCSRRVWFSSPDPETDSEDDGIAVNSPFDESLRTLFIMKQFSPDS